MKASLQFKRLKKDASLPTRAFPSDAGLDVYSLETYTVSPGSSYQFSTGIAANIPNNTYIHIHTRSSMAKKGWVVLGGVVDSSYKGELFVLLRNLTTESLTVNKGDRIAQLILHPILIPEVVEVDDVGTSDRATGAFGSSGT